MHRTVELLEVSNLDAEKREKVQEMEMCDDDEELRSLEARVAEIDERKKVLKEIIRENDRKARDLENKKQSESSEVSVLDQSWHDARYHAAITAGVSHSKAWFEEKKRRKAALHRKSGSKERAEEKLNLEKKWHEEFDSKPVKEEEFRDEAASGIETEAVIEEDDGKIRVLTGKAKQVRRGHVSFKDNKFFFKSAGTYRKLTQEEVASFKTEAKEDEARVMKKKRVDIHQKRFNLDPWTKRRRTRERRESKWLGRLRRGRLKKTSTCTIPRASWCARISREHFVDVV